MQRTARRPVAPHRSAHGDQRLALAREANIQRTGRRPVAAQTTTRTAASWPAEWPEERAALDALFAATGGLNGTWVQSANWTGAPAAVCSRFGVVCNATTGRVVELQLGSNGIEGSLPSLQPLSALGALHVSGNVLSSLSAQAFSDNAELRVMCVRERSHLPRGC